MHLVRVVVLVRAPRHAVHGRDITRRRERVDFCVHVGDGEDAGGVIELFLSHHPSAFRLFLSWNSRRIFHGGEREREREEKTYEVEEESIAATRDGVPHPTMRHRGRGIRNRQDDIQLFLLLPPRMPFRFIRFPARHHGPLLRRAVLPDPIQQVRPEGVAADVFRPEVVDVADRAREGGVEGELGGAGVAAFEGAEGGQEGVAAVGVEEGGGEEEGFGGGRWVDGRDAVAGGG